MPRLFTGIEIPADAEAALALARGGIVGARWLEPAEYHVTLRFIGDVDARVADEAADALAEIRRARIEIKFEGLSWFGADKPRAIVAKISPSAPLTELQEDHERRLRRIGLPPETRKFSPHVTLARLKGASPASVADYLAARADWSAGPFIAHRFVLYSARPGVGGGPYVVEAVYPLR